MSGLRKDLLTATTAIVLLTLLLGIAYPLATTGLAQLAFPNTSNGSKVEVDGKVVGSKLIGQNFRGPRYFHSRPSAAGDGYDAMSSSASNLGPTNEELLSAVQERIAAYRSENGLAAGEKVPVDAVTASGSGLDPQISPTNARLQAARIARARGLALDTVLHLIDENTDGRSLGFLGEPGVNVLELNLALDRQA